MKNLICLGFLLIAFQAHVILAFNVGCTVLSPSGYYDLAELSDMAAKGNDYYFSLKTQASITGTHYLGLCRAVSKQDVPPNTRVANLKLKTFISGDIGPTIELKTSGDDKYLNYYVKDGNKEFNLQLYCNLDGSKYDEPDFNNVRVEHDQAHYKLSATISHRRACAIFSIEAFYKKYKIPFAIGFIIVGLFCAFFGRKLFKIVFFFLGAFAVTAVCFLIFYQAWLIKSTNRDTIDRNTWISLGISAAIGITIGVLLVVYQRWCFFAVGGVLGGLGGFLLFTAIFAKFAPNWSLYLVIGVCVIIGGALGYFLKNPILITGTSFMGSYLAVSGIGFFAGHFPSLIEVYEKILQKNFNFKWQTYVYIVAIFLLGFLAMFVQCKYLKNNDEEEGEYKAPLTERTAYNY